MKEIKQITQEMLNTPGWTKEKSVEIAGIAATLAGNDKLPDSLSEALKAEEDAFCGWGYGGDTEYFRAKTARLAVETDRKKSEKKAAKKAAKAIQAAAMTEGFAKGEYDPCDMQIIFSEEDYKRAKKRLRVRIKSMARPE